MIRIVHMLCLIATLSVVPACTEKRQPLGEDIGRARAAFERACSACHQYEMVLRKTKTLEGWRATVQRMRDRGAALTDAEAAEVISYLAAMRGR